jgi:primosomal replication protein N
MWGAKAGVEQLPAFPEPSHFGAWQSAVPTSAKPNVVGFISEESRKNAHAMVRAHASPPPIHCRELY